MVWGLLLAAGSQYISDREAGDAAADSQKFKNTQIKLNNLEVYKETANEVSGLLAGQAILRQQASTAYTNADRAAMLGMASATTLANAAGVQGASIDAVQMDIERELAVVQADVANNVEIEQFNMTQQLRSLLAARRSQLGQTQRVMSSGDINNRAIVNTGLSVINQYASSYFEYGATSKGEA